MDFDRLRAKDVRHLFVDTIRPLPQSVDPPRQHLSVRTLTQLTHPLQRSWRVGALDCYVLEHEGTEDYIRVPTDNVWGLDVDYAGGLCAEIVAPVNVYNGSTGEVQFLDVTNVDWMRVWEASP